MSVDFPRGWQIARSAPFDSHDPACSFARTAGGMLCDCAVLLSHPEYLDDEMHGVPGSAQTSSPLVYVRQIKPGATEGDEA